MLNRSHTPSFFQALPSYGTVPQEEKQATNRLEAGIEFLKSKINIERFISWLYNHKASSLAMMGLFSLITLILHYSDEISILNLQVDEDSNSFDTALRQYSDHKECPNDWYHPEQTISKTVVVGQSAYPIIRNFLKIEDYCAKDLPSFATQMLSQLNPQVCLEIFSKICSMKKNNEEDTQTRALYFLEIIGEAVLVAILAIFMIYLFCLKRGQISQREAAVLVQIQIDQLIPPVAQNLPTLLSGFEGKSALHQEFERYRKRVSVARDSFNDEIIKLNVNGESVTGIGLTMLGYANLFPLEQDEWLTAKMQNENFFNDDVIPRVTQSHLR